MMFLISIIVIGLIGLFLILPISKKIRQKNSTGLDFLLGSFLLIVGILLAQKYSDSLDQDEEKEQVILTIERAIMESNDVLEIMQGFEYSISDINNPQDFTSLMKNNPLPTPVIFENFDRNPVIINNISNYTFQAFSASKRNLNTLRNFSQDELGVAGINKVIHGYIHEIENIVDFLYLEIDYLEEKIDKETHKNLLKSSIASLRSKNAQIAQQFAGKEAEDYTYKALNHETTKPYK